MGPFRHFLQVNYASGGVGPVRFHVRRNLPRYFQKGKMTFEMGSLRVVNAVGRVRGWFGGNMGSFQLKTIAMLKSSVGAL